MNDKQRADFIHMATQLFFEVHIGKIVPMDAIDNMIAWINLLLREEQK